jgi:hypothetical protein
MARIRELVGDGSTSTLNTFLAPILVEDRNHPATAHLPKEMVVHDEIYQFKNYSCGIKSGC